MAESNIPPTMEVEEEEQEEEIPEIAIGPPTVGTSRFLTYALYCDVCEGAWYGENMARFEDHMHGSERSHLIYHYFCTVCAVASNDLQGMFRQKRRISENCRPIHDLRSSHREKSAFNGFEY